MIPFSLILEVASTDSGRLSRLTVDTGAPGWISDGFFAANIGDVPKHPDIADWYHGKPGALSKLVAGYQAGPAIPVTEVAALRLPGSAVHSKCRECGGTKTVLGLGQVVWEGANVRSAMSNRIWRLFDGLDVFRLGETEHSAFGSFEGNRIVLFAMPLRSVIDPQAGKVA